MAQEGHLNGQFAANSQIHTLWRMPPSPVPSWKPAFANLLSLAKTLPIWFMVAPQRNRLFTCSNISLVLAWPSAERYSAISDLNLVVLPIKLHLWYVLFESDDAMTGLWWKYMVPNSVFLCAYRMNLQDVWWFSQPTAEIQRHHPSKINTQILFLCPWRGLSIQVYEAHNERAKRE